MTTVALPCEGQERAAELDCETFNKLEKVIGAPEFLRTLEAATAKPEKRRTFLKWRQPQWQVEMDDKPVHHTETTHLHKSASDAGLTVDAALSEESHLDKSWQQEDFLPCTEEDYIVIEKKDAVEAMAFYIAMCICDMPEAQALAPRQLQLALLGALQGLKKSKFKQLCAWGRYAYRWSALTYSALQMYQNPWLMQAVLTAIWTASRLSLRALW